VKLEISSCLSFVCVQTASINTDYTRRKFVINFTGREFNSRRLHNLKKDNRWLTQKGWIMLQY